MVEHCTDIGVLTGNFYILGGYLHLTISYNEYVISLSTPYSCFYLIVTCLSRLLAPLTDSIIVEAAHKPQFPCSKISRKTG